VILGLSNFALKKATPARLGPKPVFIQVITVDNFSEIFFIDAMAQLSKLVQAAPFAKNNLI
jgi:hypothetical protein